MNVTSFLQEHTMLLDGGMGTLLQAAGMRPGETSESWNLKHPEVVEGILTDYYEAGSNAVNTNTFGVNGLKYGADAVKELTLAAVDIAKRARDRAKGDRPRFIALDLGPTGQFLEPFGDLEFDEAVEAYAQVVRAGAAAGADYVMVETMIDLEETRAAVRAAKQNCDLPVFASNTYGKEGRLLTGAAPAQVIAMLQEEGVQAMGVNCSFGPEALMDVVNTYLANTSLPVLCKPNAGMPAERDGKMTYDIGPDAFAASVKKMADAGARILGGCCGTTPDYIRALRALLP